MKKLIYVAAVAVALLSLISCPKENSIAPYVDSVTTNEGTEIAKGDYLDPLKVDYIDITFDQAMDTSRTGFLSYWFKDPAGNTDAAIMNSGWVTNKTLRIYVNLVYNRNFEISWNDETYSGEDYTKKDDYFKSKSGTYAEYDYVYFQTVKSPNEGTAQNYTVNIDFEQSIKLARNEWTDSEGNSGVNQQCVYGDFSRLLNYDGTEYNHDYLRAGDTVTVNYKISSGYDLTPVKVNIVDTSSLANYWTILSDLTEGDFAGLSLVDSSYKVNEEYTGSLTFNVAADMIDYLCFQIYAPIDEDNYYNINFLNLSE